MGTGLWMSMAITGATMLVLACVGLPFLIASWNGRQLLATGIAAQAVIESMADTGVTINGQPLVSFVLGVRTRDGQVHRGHAPAVAAAPAHGHGRARRGGAGQGGPAAARPGAHRLGVLASHPVRRVAAESQTDPSGGFRTGYVLFSIRS